jgi:hypothetical protein
MKGSTSRAEHGRSHWQNHRGQTEVGGDRHRWLLMVKKKAAVEEDVTPALLGSVIGHAQGDDGGAHSGSSWLAVRRHGA